jgi:hypothetical protein
MDSRQRTATVRLARPFSRAFQLEPFDAPACNAITKAESGKPKPERILFAAIQFHPCL